MTLRVTLLARKDARRDGPRDASVVRLGVMEQRTDGQRPPRGQLQTFDDRRVGHPAAFADGRQRVASLAPLELMQGGQDQPRTARAKWVTESNRATVDIEPVHSDA